MKKFSGVTKALSITAAVFLCSSNLAQAASITFGGAIANDGSGLTSTFMDPVSGGLSGYFIETFDKATGDMAFPGSTAYTIPGFENECAVNSLNTSPIGVDVTANVSEVGVRKGTVSNVAAAPANDTTCYGYVTNNGSGTSTISFDYNDLLTYFTSTLNSNTLLGITYLGFYWGSIDTYNDFKFYSGGNLVTSITGSQLVNGTLSGNQTSPASNTYVNIAFSIAEQFDTLVIDTSGVAGEFDNIVIGLSTREIPVPAPSGLALIVFCLVALGIRSRLKR